MGAQNRKGGNDSAFFLYAVFSGPMEAFVLDGARPLLPRLLLNAGVQFGVAGLGSVAAVVGLTFHSFAYLTKAYAESIEEMDPGVIEALRANGASYWQIVCQAIVPTTITSMIAWTFMRFEINFANAVAMGAAAGAGGIGFNLFMAGSFYFDLHEMGMLTYIVVIAVVLLEMLSTKIKAKVR